MFSYVCLGTNDLPRAVAFYDAVITPLGHVRCELDLDGGNATWGWCQTNSNQSQLGR